MTSRNTFQKLFQPDELRYDVETATANRCVAASATRSTPSGKTDRLALITRRVAPEFDWTEEGPMALSVVSDWWDCGAGGARQHSMRIPADQLEEIGVTPNQIRQFIKKGADRTLVEAGARKTIPTRCSSWAWRYSLDERDSRTPRLSSTTYASTSRPTKRHAEGQTDC